MSMAKNEREYPEIIYEQKCRIAQLEAALQEIGKRHDFSKMPDYMAAPYLKEFREIAEEALKWS